MSGSVEIVLWLHEYELKALEKQLASNGTDVESECRKCLLICILSAFLLRNDRRYRNASMLNMPRQ